jgi:hypothetical protein
MCGIFKFVLKNDFCGEMLNQNIINDRKMKRKQQPQDSIEIQSQEYQHFHSNVELLKSIKYQPHNSHNDSQHSNHQAWCCINNVFNLLPPESQSKLMNTLQLRIMIFSNIDQPIIDQLWKTANTCDDYLCNYKYKPFKVCKHKLEKIRSWFSATSSHQTNA